MHYELEYDPKAWEGDPDTIRHWMRRRVDADLNAFKAYIEEDTPPKMLKS